jgi:hypothetical protein
VTRSARIRQGQPGNGVTRPVGYQGGPTSPEPAASARQKRAITVRTEPYVAAATTGFVDEIRAALRQLSPEARDILERTIRGELRARRRTTKPTPRSPR